MTDVKKVRFKDVRDLPLKELVIGKSQVRLSDAGKDIAELADSIRKVGLLEPIVVSESPDQPGKYEIVTGQRRFLAHVELGAETIWSAILAEPVDEIEAKILSVTENLLRRDLNRKDLIDVCTELYKRYGTMKMVSEETGLPYPEVRKYVKYDRLIPELRELVDEGLDVNAALRAQDAASVTGNVEVDEAVQFAKEMSTVSGAQQKKMLETRQALPELSADEVIEDAKSGGKITQINVGLTSSIHQSLGQYARSEGMSQDDAAAGLIEDSLRDRGFLG